ncbi:uncharacterized protein LOC134649076 [Cydia amplana]|uniref:uncharacterized protein LOC134649076 n=1 Tax=Cydia amplana TaxID=1869771 RepID=UPI002FE66B6F
MRTMYSEILIFCGLLVLVNTYPALVYDYYNPNTRDVEDIEFRDNYQSSDLESPCLRSHNGDVKCFFYNEISENIPETPDYSSIPESPIELAGRQLEQDSIYEEKRDLVNPAATELLPQNPNYNAYNYESSPIRTYIHGLVPQHSSAYYGDIYPAVNPMPFNRLTRRATSYEEFLAQLSHDAQMNNILPTMSYLRTAGPNYYAPYGNGPVQATFPQAVGGCSRPLLFGCSPIIYQGVMAHKGYAYPPAVQVLHPTSYKESLRNQKVIRNKVKPPADKNKQDHREALKLSKEPSEEFIAN